MIYGYDKERGVRDITFENVWINGELIENALQGNIIVGDYVSGIQFK